MALFVKQATKMFVADTFVQTVNTAPVVDIGGLVADPQPEYRLPLSNPEIPVEPSRATDQPVAFIGHADHYINGTDASEQINLDGGLFNDSFWVDAGGGNDVVKGGWGDDMIRGGAGNDRINGGFGDDQIAGGTGNDSLYGDPGNDRLYGEAGDDQLLGGVGNDFLSGGTGNDVLDGGSQDDQLFGDYGNDWLKGGDGKDTINGGRGADVMTGGEGGDTFVFTSVQDSLKLWGKFDTITDFKRGEDHLDFHLIDANENVAGDQKFALVAYSGPNQILSAGQMTAYYDAALGKTIIEANVDGDASNEFHLELDGNVVPKASDMIL